MATRSGYECYLYYAAGGIGVGEWVSGNKVKDVSYTQTRETVTEEHRGLEVKKSRPLGRTESLDFELNRDYSEETYAALKAAYESATPIGICTCDKKIDADPAGTGYFIDGLIMEFSSSESLNDIATVSVKIEPHSDTDFTPGVYATNDAEVAGGTP